MDWKVVLVIVFIFVILDKGLTYASIRQVQRNFPEADHLSIEKNKVAGFFFKNFGLGWGSIIFGILTYFVTVGGFYLLSRNLSKWSFTAGNPQGIAMYILFMLYAFVVFNNTYFLLRYSKVF